MSALTSQEKRKAPDAVKTARQIAKVIDLAKRWAVFQEDDSRADQVLDGRLATEAAHAKRDLLAAIEKLP